MHAEEARQAGVEQRKIDLVAAWHEAGRCSPSVSGRRICFTEAVTIIADGGVPDDVGLGSSRFDDREIVQLLVAHRRDQRVELRGTSRSAPSSGPEPYRA